MYLPNLYVIPAKAGIYTLVIVIALEESAAISISLTENFSSKKEEFLEPFAEYKNIIVYIT
ncbi:MAG: hypothetical protein PHW73_09915, partial [Atribacterota bacterium]|nr:hypothetical protein [Atribacterota bacterium]